MHDEQCAGKLRTQVGIGPRALERNRQAAELIMTAQNRG